MVPRCTAGEVCSALATSRQAICLCYAPPARCCNRQVFTNTPPLEELSPPTNGGEFTFTFTQPGVFWFACPVPGHCNAGMKIKFTVS